MEISEKFKIWEISEKSEKFQKIQKISFSKIFPNFRFWIFGKVRLSQKFQKIANLRNIRKISNLEKFRKITKSPKIWGEIEVVKKSKNVSFLCDFWILFKNPYFSKIGSENLKISILRFWILVKFTLKIWFQKVHFAITLPI